MMALTKKRHRSGDGWGRGDYDIPALTVMGASDMGEFRDSPAPTNQVRSELDEFRYHLKKNGISSKLLSAGSTGGNIFMGKMWVKVDAKDFAKAKGRV